MSVKIYMFASSSSVTLEYGPFCVFFPHFRMNKLNLLSGMVPSVSLTCLPVCISGWVEKVSAVLEVQVPSLWTKPIHLCVRARLQRHRRERDITPVWEQDSGTGRVEHVLSSSEGVCVCVCTACEFHFQRTGQERES